MHKNPELHRRELNKAGFLLGFSWQEDFHGSFGGYIYASTKQLSEDVMERGILYPGAQYYFPIPIDGKLWNADRAYWTWTTDPPEEDLHNIAVAKGRLETGKYQGVFTPIQGISTIRFPPPDFVCQVTLYENSSETEEVRKLVKLLQDHEIPILNTLEERTA